MTSEATIGAATATPGVASRPAIRNAGRVLGGAGLLGIVGQLLFFDVGLGINFPIAITVLLAGAWLLRRRRPWPVRHDAWLGPAAIVFAAFAAVRADPTIAFLDVLTSLALAGFALASLGGRQVVTLPFSSLVRLAFGALGWVMTGAAPAIGAARDQMPSAAALGRRAAPAMPVVRGLVLAVPVVILFIALFASADAVFGRLVEDLFGFELEFGDVGWRLAVAACLAWLAAGGLALAASVPATRTPETAARARPNLHPTEILTVLIAVAVVFGIFVALQAAYLFGGLDTLAAAGMTYADYARRGFFELVAVAVLAGGLVIVADRVTRTRTRPLVAAAITLTALTGVVLVSAALRLRLYQEAYGWTELRLYVLSTIVLLAVGVVGLVLALAANRVRWIGHVLIVAALVIGLGLNVIGPARFITEQNVARVLDPSLVPPNGSTGLDEAYALSLGDDAVPDLLRALPALDATSARFLETDLAVRLSQLRNEAGLNAWQAWNAGRSAARDALEAARVAGNLP